jgi:hypothetical protein
MDKRPIFTRKEKKKLSSAFTFPSPLMVYPVIRNRIQCSTFRIIGKPLRLGPGGECNQSAKQGDYISQQGNKERIKSEVMGSITATVLLFPRHYSRCIWPHSDRRWDATGGETAVIDCQWHQPCHFPFLSAPVTLTAGLQSRLLSVRIHTFLLYPDLTCNQWRI